MASTSRGSSTTQSTVRSRLGERQIVHCSPSAMKKQSLQNRMRALTSVSAAASRSTDSLGVRKIYKDRRWAVFGPILGSRLSSSITRANADGNSALYKDIVNSNCHNTTH